MHMLSSIHVPYKNKPHLPIKIELEYFEDTTALRSHRHMTQIAKLVHVTLYVTSRSKSFQEKANVSESLHQIHVSL
jgi:hypothetical protein